MYRFLDWMVKKHPVLLAFWLLVIVLNALVITFAVHTHWLNWLAIGCLVGSMTGAVLHYKKTG